MARQVEVPVLQLDAPQGAPPGHERAEGVPASDGEPGPHRADFARWGGVGGSGGAKPPS